MVHGLVGTDLLLLVLQDLTIPEELLLLMLLLLLLLLFSLPLLSLPLSTFPLNPLLLLLLLLQPLALPKPLLGLASLPVGEVETTIRLSAMHHDESWAILLL